MIPNLEFPSISPPNFTVCIENIMSLLEYEFHKDKLNKEQKIEQLIDQDTYRTGGLEINALEPPITIESVCNDSEINRESYLFALE